MLQNCLMDLQIAPIIFSLEEMIKMKKEHLYGKMGLHLIIITGDRVNLMTLKLGKQVVRIVLRLDLVSGMIYLVQFGDGKVQNHTFYVAKKYSIFDIVSFFSI